MTMQPNNKCTCPSGDGSLRWPCPAHPAAAAHEAVGEVYQGSARRPQAKLNAELPVGTKLYAAPVTAAQEAVDAMLAMGFIWDSGAWRAQSDGGMQDERNRWFIRAGEYLKRAQDAEAKLASTPAAPGIDLADLRAELAAIVNDWHGPGPKTGPGGCCVACNRWTPWGSPEADDHHHACPEKAEWVRRRHWQQRISNLVAKIDASPKGGSDEAAWSAGYRAAMNAAASGVQELYRNHVHHTGSDGLIARAMELEQSFIRDAAMQAQASYAEVRP